ncbi:hypothetical protein AF72_11910 [Xylella taiwanensis]|uniref:Uncharacterized protein n=1 Tax=Xylella taiwanensis TaxID=1444770 RepID=Z9JGA1_9GAMM|nr:hypothetical protein AB672_06880 [Xylella taiwanensis]EWS77219.1 hypothetical protein AF72_11910 [Xylella taiwanensis]
MDLGVIVFSLVCVQLLRLSIESDCLAMIGLSIALHTHWDLSRSACWPLNAACSAGRGVNEGLLRVGG